MADKVKMALGFGIIGCGTIANWHVAGIRACKDATLVGAADFKPEFSEKFCAKYGIKQFMSVEEMLACPEIDVVCICTPSGLHASYAIEVANAGKHIIVEKPMALTVEDCDKVIKACDDNNVKCCVISQLRFTNTVRTIKDAVEKGKLGKIVTADIFMKFFRSQEYYDGSNWRGTWKMDGGGALMNQGVHGIDLLQYIMGKVKSVYGYARTLARNIEVEDTCSAVLEFENGAIGIIQGTTSVYPGYPRRLSISGTKGTITINEEIFEAYDIEGEDTLPENVVIGGDQRSSASDPTNMDTQGHELQIGDMVDAILNDRKPLIDARDGKRPVQIITSIYKSSETGNRIDFDE